MQEIRPDKRSSFNWECVYSEMVDSVFCVGFGLSFLQQCATGQSERRTPLINSPKPHMLVSAQPGSNASLFLPSSNRVPAMRDIRCYQHCRLHKSTANGWTHEFTVLHRDLFSYRKPHITKKITLLEKLCKHFFKILIYKKMSVLTETKHEPLS